MRERSWRKSIVLPRPGQNSKRRTPACSLVSAECSRPINGRPFRQKNPICTFRASTKGRETILHRRLLNKIVSHLARQQGISVTPSQLVLCAYRPDQRFNPFAISRRDKSVAVKTLPVHRFERGKML